jgi:hypothetical protein
MVNPKVTFLHAEVIKFLSPLHELKTNKAGLTRLLAPLGYVPLMAALSSDGYTFALPELDEFEQLLLDQLPTPLDEDVLYDLSTFLSQLGGTLGDINTSVRDILDGALTDAVPGLSSEDRETIREAIFTDIMHWLITTYLQREYGLLFNLGLFVDLVVAEPASPLSAGIQSIREGGSYRYRFHHEKVAEYAKNVLFLLKELFVDTQSPKEFLDRFLALILEKSTALANSLHRDTVIGIDFEGISFTSSGLVYISDDITLLNDDLAVIHLNCFERIEFRTSDTGGVPDPPVTVKFFWKTDPAISGTDLLSCQMGPWSLALSARDEDNVDVSGIEIIKAGHQIEIHMNGFCQISRTNLETAGEEEDILSSSVSLRFVVDTRSLTDVIPPRLPAPTFVIELQDILFNGADLVHRFGDGENNYAVTFASTGGIRIESELHAQRRLYYEVMVALNKFSLLLPKEIVRKGRLESGKLVGVSDDQARITFETTSGNGHLLQLVVDSNLELFVGVLADEAGNLSNPLITSDPFFIGDLDDINSGLLIIVEQVTFDVSEGKKTLLHGIAIEEATVFLPNNLPQVAPDELTLHGFRVDKRGISLSVSGLWDVDPETLDPSIPNQGFFGLPGYLQFLSLTIEENVPTVGDISGFLWMPFFDEFLEISVTIDVKWDFLISISSLVEDGVPLIREELISLHLQSLNFNKEENIVKVIISGGLEPLLMAADGLEWPRLDVEDLSVEQDVTDLTKPPGVKFNEAWLDLKELATLDLWGFHFELSRIGLGYQETDDKLWFDLSGSLRLIEQIPVGLGVEGFRLTWPRTLYEQLAIEGPPTLDEALAIAGELEVKFDGIYLFYGVPEAVEFEGLIRFIKNAQTVGFAGDMALRVPASGFAAEAGLMVGMNFETPPYPFLYVYLGVELPAGIPLGQSGLALKGALGLFGLNVAPDKTAEQNWYYDWYKRGPIVGAHPTNKWRNERAALALGFGLTITTVDGYVKGVRGLLVLAIPGPILIIEGRALILNGLLPAEPPLRALAVFDGRERIVQFNVEAEAELIEDMLDAYGMLEAFFDFKDLTNWHLYLGQEEPRDRRIQANVFKLNDAFLFKADAYLMVDMIGAHTLRSRMGVFVGFKPPIPDIGPVKITLDAVLEGSGEVTVLPEQFSGEVALSGTIGLEAFGFSVQIAAGAEVVTEGPRPLKVDAEAYVNAEMPWPLEDFEETFQFSWQAPEPPEIVPPLVSVTAASLFAPGGGGLQIHERVAVEDQSIWRAAAENSPVVPIDTRPILAFSHEMNDVARVPTGAQPQPAFARHPTGTAKTYDVGLMRFSPTLTTIRLYEHRKGEAWPGSLDGWKLVASSRTADLSSRVEPLPGVWMAEADPQDPGEPPARRLHLWINNPLLHAANALGSGYSRLLGRGPAAKSYAEEMLDLHPDLMKCTYTEPRRVCVDFAGTAGTTLKPGIVWEHRGLRFTALASQASVQVERVSRPSLDLNIRWEIQRALAVFDSRFNVPRLIIDEPSLLAWARTVPTNQRKLIQQSLPNLKTVWDWLWPSATERTCLMGQGPFSIRFPAPVSEVWIRFCELPKIPDDDPSSVIDTARGARNLAELKEIEEEAKRKGVEPDLSACRFPVAHEVSADNDTWIIRTDLGFDCLDLFKKEEDFGLFEICYLTATEAERATRAAAECKTNEEGTSDPQNVLQPGSYYRLDIETNVAGELTNLNDDVLSSIYGAVLEQLVFGDSAEPYRHVAFFQTEGPPTSLARYVKWCNPPHQAIRVFRKDDFAIRFLRPNMKEMYGHPPHRLEMLIRSSAGQLISGSDTAWRKAGSASLLHEEQLWREHRSEVGLANAAAEADDVLVARRASAELEPSARYELLVSGGEGGELLFQDDFADLSGETWKPTLKGWSAQEGVLARRDNSPAHITAGNPNWTDLDLAVELRLTNNRAGGVLIRALQRPGKAGGKQVWNASRVSLTHTGSGRFLLNLDALQHDPAVGDALVTKSLGSRPFTLDTGLWNRLRVSLVANRLRVWVFDELLMEGTLCQIVRDWTTQKRLPGTLLFFDHGSMDAEHRQAIERGNLLPSVQGQIGLYAAGTGPEFRRMRVRNAVLHRVSFTTSAFAGFRELVESGKSDSETDLAEPENAYAPVSITVTTPIDDIAQAIGQASANQATANLAGEAWAWHCAQIDYRFEALDRPGLEERKLALRKARADHDAAFRALAEVVEQDLHYSPLAPRVELYLLRKDTGEVLGLWLRSPESLDLWQHVRDSDGNHVGRTTIIVTQSTASSDEETEVSEVGIKIFHDADSSQILIFRENNAVWPAGPYQVTFAYYRNHGDEASEGDHRYDRPVEMSGGMTNVETVQVIFTI